MPVKDGLVGDVLGQRRLADAVGADDDRVGGVAEEVQAEERLDGGAVALGGPGPVEVAQRLEAADAGGLQTPLEALLGALGLLPVEEPRGPSLGLGLVEMGVQAVQPELQGALA